MEHELGYLKGKLESLENKVAEHIEWEEAYHDKFDAKLDRILTEISIARHFILFMKLTGYTAIAVLAFKFGDIKDIWGGWK